MSPSSSVVSPGPVLDCRGLTLGYGSSPVVSLLDLTVQPGETLALLGPSGSGKTTILHGIAGFLRPLAGEIALGGRVVASASRSDPPERRDVGMVFQHYALWPHLSALETVAYPYRRRGHSPAEASARARTLLERFGLTALADRRPAELSGGEQQRVGLARALAREPRLFLFDEPTAHLDAPLREALEESMAEARSSSGAAAIHATHDVAEALAAADRVALLDAGRVVQLGTPTSVYERPVSLWAARLTGRASLLSGSIVTAAGGAVALAAPDVASRVPLPGAELDGRAAPDVRALVRPDWVHLDGPLPGVVERRRFRGPHTDYRLATPLGQVLVREPGPPRLAPGASTTWRLDRAWLVPSTADVVADATSDRS